jgi:hypothetical protein
MELETGREGHSHHRKLRLCVAECDGGRCLQCPVESTENSELGGKTW